METPIYSGCIVNLLDEDGNLIVDREKISLKYQVVSVYQSRGKVSLVTSYGEYVGLHPIKDIIYVSSAPMFTKEEYKEGSVVSWIEHDSVYEGVIDVLHDSYASVINIKKLMPINTKSKVPYWKIYNDHKSSPTTKEDNSIGDDLD